MGLLTLMFLWKGSVKISMLLVLFLLFSPISPLPLMSMSVVISVAQWETIYLVYFMVLVVWTSLLMVLVQYGLGTSFISLVAALGLTNLFFFCSENLLLLYLFFEISLIPTVLIILRWGYQPERIQAGMYFMMYTVCASLPLLVAILKGESGGLWSITLIMAFLVKVPLYGLHIWLPKAHVEAPVSGSMVLAGVLLKLGGWGLMKVVYLYKLCNLWVLSLSLWSSALVGVICMRQTDVKKLVAYSSVAHMGLMVASILTLSKIGFLGGVMMMIAHGVSSSGLFAAANVNYSTLSSRNLSHYKGVYNHSPEMGLIWFVLLAANMAGPPSLNLISEIMIIISVLKFGATLSIVFFIGIFLSAAYNLFLFSSQVGFSPMKGNTTSLDLMQGLLHLVPCLGLSLVS